MQEFFINQYDRLPVIRKNFSDSTGYINLTNSIVNFIYRNRWVQGAPITGSGSIISAVSGLVEYAWTTGDVTNPGAYFGQFRATLPDGKEISYPNDAYLSFEIFPDLI